MLVFEKIQMGYRDFSHHPKTTDGWYGLFEGLAIAIAIPVCIILATVVIQGLALLVFGLKRRSKPLTGMGVGMLFFVLVVVPIAYLYVLGSIDYNAVESQKVRMSKVAQMGAQEDKDMRAQFNNDMRTWFVLPDTYVASNGTVYNLTERTYESGQLSPYMVRATNSKMMVVSSYKTKDYVGSFHITQATVNDDEAFNKPRCLAALPSCKPFCESLYSRVDCFVRKDDQGIFITDYSAVKIDISHVLGSLQPAQSSALKLLHGTTSY